MHCLREVQPVLRLTAERAQTPVECRRSIAGYSGLSSPFCLSMYLGVSCNVSRGRLNNPNKLNGMSSCLLGQMYLQLSKSGQTPSHRMCCDETPSLVLTTRPWSAAVVSNRGQGEPCLRDATLATHVFNAMEGQDTHDGDTARMCCGSVCASSTVRSNCGTEGSLCRMVSLRHRIGQTSPVASLARHAARVLHVRRSTSPPPTATDTHKPHNTVRKSRCNSCLRLRSGPGAPCAYAGCSSLVRSGSWIM
jgi:hypothetical protein